jgi:predicted nucleic acid-binding protein
MERQLRIYMDVCCLNRPFDDWTQPRIRLEAEAVLAIASRCQLNQWQLIKSTALESEILRTPDPIRRQRVLDSLTIASSNAPVTEETLNRAKDLSFFGLKSFDALHIACAEAMNGDVFLTTDDRLLRKAQTNQSEIKVPVANPVTWLMAISELQGDDKNDTN